MLNNIFKLNKLDIKFLLILSFYWLSINTGSKYINFNEISEYNFEYYFNFIRSILPYLVFVYFIESRASCNLGVHLGATWTNLRLTFDNLGRTWDQVGANFDSMGANLAHLGANLG